MRRRWSEDEIWMWYADREWISGFNFVPSTSTGGVLYLLQEYGHDEAFRQAAKEIALAASLGLNSVRVHLPFEVWLHQHDAFFTHLDEFLTLLDGYGMTMMPILFGDCVPPRSAYREPVFGPQPEPVPGYFGGTDANSFDDDTQFGSAVGYSIIDEPGMDGTVERYVREMARRYGTDKRILIWNVWNELGNSSRGDMSMPLMRKVFTWLREEDVTQPLTAEVWGAMPDNDGDYYRWLNDPRIHSETERESVELSDIVSFHYYGDYLHAKRFIAYLRRFDRPLINTEWMHRPLGSCIETHLPLWKREGIGSYFFGFVNGKTQFDVVWDFLKPYPSVDRSLWMHDIFHDDFTPYDRDEIAVIKACNANKELPAMRYGRK